MDAGWMLRMARNHAGLSQREVARRAGVPQSTVARVERGHIDPRVTTLDRLLHACGFELSLAVAQHDDAGVDRSLIREQLARSPTERVRAAAAVAELTEGLRVGAR
jgi:transcriptional regulator with XRE-family HTH domain